MNKKKLVIFFLLMLINHIAHVFEEVWGQFFLLNRVGLGTYLIVNLILFCIPVMFFYFVLYDRLWAIKLSIVYAVFMSIQGLGHNIATIISGRYYDGFAGGFTGIGLIIFGFGLIYYLLKELRTRKFLV